MARQIVPVTLDREMEFDGLAALASGAPHISNGEACAMCDGTGAWAQAPCVELVFSPTCAHHRSEIAATFDPLVLSFGAAAALLFILPMMIG